MHACVVHLYKYKQCVCHEHKTDFLFIFATYRDVFLLPFSDLIFSSNLYTIITNIRMISYINYILIHNINILLITYIFYVICLFFHVFLIFLCTNILTYTYAIWYTLHIEYKNNWMQYLKGVSSIHWYAKQGQPIRVNVKRMKERHYFKYNCFWYKLLNNTGLCDVV